MAERCSAKSSIRHSIGRAVAPGIKPFLNSLQESCLALNLPLGNVGQWNTEYRRSNQDGQNEGTYDGPVFVTRENVRVFVKLSAIRN